MLPDAGIAQQALGQHGQGDRHVLHGLFALLRGDDHGTKRGDFFLLLVIFGHLRRLHHRCRGQRRPHRQGQAVATWNIPAHDASLPSF